MTPKMNPKTLQKFKERLEAERDSLLRVHDDHEQNLRDNQSGKDVDVPDRAAKLEKATVEAHIVESEERLLEKISHALKRIDEGVYHMCEECEQLIAEARLEVKPSVSLCVDCQEAKDAAPGAR